ncbi:hypothetical protein CVT24_006827 [Panaeolus cyanescens]|uniref:Uncharacterized protein n=1 Tax=Panaeolus cyanescens TaxID=181874 RepID=A0A409YRX1_9AGAR|nr:hypothetical protein CVT24_006827 [Panaeolus cyanescens]
MNDRDLLIKFEKELRPDDVVFFVYGDANLIKALKSLGAEGMKEYHNILTGEGGILRIEGKELRSNTTPAVHFPDQCFKSKEMRMNIIHPVQVPDEPCQRIIVIECIMSESSSKLSDDDFKRKMRGWFAPCVKKQIKLVTIWDIYSIKMAQNLNAQYVRFARSCVDVLDDMNGFFCASETGNQPPEIGERALPHSSIPYKIVVGATSWADAAEKVEELEIEAKKRVKELKQHLDRWIETGRALVVELQEERVPEVQNISLNFDILINSLELLRLTMTNFRLDQPAGAPVAPPLPSCRLNQFREIIRQNDIIILPSSESIADLSLGVRHGLLPKTDPEEMTINIIPLFHVPGNGIVRLIVIECAHPEKPVDFSARPPSHIARNELDITCTTEDWIDVCDSWICLTSTEKRVKFMGIVHLRCTMFKGNDLVSSLRNASRILRYLQSKSKKHLGMQGEDASKCTEASPQPILYKAVFVTTGMEEKVKNSKAEVERMMRGLGLTCTNVETAHIHTVHAQEAKGIIHNMLSDILATHGEGELQF